MSAAERSALCLFDVDGTLTAPRQASAPRRGREGRAGAGTPDLGTETASAPGGHGPLLRGCQLHPLSAVLDVLTAV